MKHQHHKEEHDRKLVEKIAEIKELADNLYASKHSTLNIINDADATIACLNQLRSDLIPQY